MYVLAEGRHLAPLPFADPVTREEDDDRVARDSVEGIRDGAARRDGRVPVNPSGGLLGAGHPIGATGVRQVLESWKQATGRAGASQLSERPRTMVTSNLGGDDRTGVVMVHRAAG